MFGRLLAAGDRREIRDFDSRPAGLPPRAQRIPQEDDGTSRHRQIPSHGWLPEDQE